MPAAISLITLLTDFGEHDYFVASMKGVILNINPQVRIVDLSHRVSPYCIEDAGYFLKSSCHYFPVGTIHVAVVDPGVGSARRPLLVSTSRYFFLAPDNGLLSSALKDERSVEIRHIENKQYRLDSEGATFDGRDVFAPAAAWLTRGQPPGSFGRLIHDPVTLPDQEPAWEGSTLIGRIVYVDHFGNAISNITSSHLSDVRKYTKRTSVTIRIAGATIDDLVTCYADGKTDAPRAVVNSNGHVEIFLKEGSAATVLNVGKGDRIEIH
jgi:S-adenosylmethionine hydrolase